MFPSLGCWAREKIPEQCFISVCVHVFFWQVSLRTEFPLTVIRLIFILTAQKSCIYSAIPIKRG